ncbi:MAG: glycoside hydrolase family 5 protein [Phycisphaerales bacterium]|nr:glycoside hydrolase family 5 protein [Phycisphaerales bacterium]
MIVQARELTIQGDQFLLDGKPFKPWGIRVASASQTEEDTRHLIEQLDEYLAHGVNAITVFYQGSSGGYSNPFSADGKQIDPGHQKRMEEIIQAAAARKMMVIVGVFYQRAAVPFKDKDAVREVLRTVTRSLIPYRNLIINIANEQNSKSYQKMSLIWDVSDPQTIIELCKVVHEVDPKRLVGGGGYKHELNEIIGLSDAVDVLLFDTDRTNPGSDELYARFRAAGITGKPIVNVETFGGWTKQFLPQGVFSDQVKDAYFAEIEAASRCPGLSVFFHNNPWCQGLAQGLLRRYDLGGQGTESDPGMRWYFERVRTTAKSPSH